MIIKLLLGCSHLLLQIQTQEELLPGICFRSGEGCLVRGRTRGWAGSATQAPFPQTTRLTTPRPEPRIPGPPQPAATRKAVTDQEQEAFAVARLGPATSQRLRSPCGKKVGGRVSVDVYTLPGTRGFSGGCGASCSRSPQTWGPPAVPAPPQALSRQPALRARAPR